MLLLTDRDIASWLAAYTQRNGTTEVSELMQMYPATLSSLVAVPTIPLPAHVCVYVLALL